MSEQVFRSPNFYEREMDLSTPITGGPVGTPAGVIGPTQKGPAFIPITVASFGEFVSTFGDLDPKYFGPYAVNEFLKNRASLTYLRVLGGGANSSLTDFDNTLTNGTVRNAGFSLPGVVAQDDARHTQVVQFLAAQHTLSANEAYGMPMFSDNDTFPGVTAGSNVNLIRAAVMVPNTARIFVLDGDESVPAAASVASVNDQAQAKSINVLPRLDTPLINIFLTYKL